MSRSLIYLGISKQSQNRLGLVYYYSTRKDYLFISIQSIHTHRLTEERKCQITTNRDLQQIHQNRTANFKIATLANHPSIASKFFQFIMMMTTEMLQRHLKVPLTRTLLFRERRWQLSSSNHMRVTVSAHRLRERPFWRRNECRMKTTSCQKITTWRNRSSRVLCLRDSTITCKSSIKAAVHHRSLKKR